jgi:hypothetical protein
VDRIVPLHEVEMMRRLIFHMVLGFALAVAAGGFFTLQAATTAAQFDGRPQFKEGKAFGYFIWREGDTWKVRWTTFGADREEDHINQESEHEIRFAARTDDDLDGFDFKVGQRTDRIRFRLQIDGRTRAEEIEIGARNSHPDEDPLVAILR